MVRREILKELDRIAGTMKRTERYLEQVRSIVKEIPAPVVRRRPALVAETVQEILASSDENDIDPWSELVVPWCNRPTVRAGIPMDHPLESLGKEHGVKQRVYLAEIMKHALGQTGWVEHRDKIRVGVILRRAGWRKRREGYNRHHDGTRKEYWLPPFVTGTRKPLAS